MDSNKIGVIAIIVVISLVSGLFAFLFFNCIASYSKFDVSYGDLVYRELTFDRYEKKPQGKSGYAYDIYFKEYDDPFQIDSIARKKVSGEALEQLVEWTMVKIYTTESSSRNYEYEICEMSQQNQMVLSLSDYVEANQENQIVGMIVCPLMVLDGLFLIWVTSRLSKPIGTKDDLGKIRIEYETNDNVIRVYNSPYVCSLMINGEIVDRYYGLEGNNFCLKGKLDIGEEKIAVEAKMGYFYMQLYYDGELVAKKFMALG